MIGIRKSRLSSRTVQYWVVASMLGSSGGPGGCGRMMTISSRPDSDQSTLPQRMGFSSASWGMSLAARMAVSRAGTW